MNECIEGGDLPKIFDSGYVIALEKDVNDVQLDSELHSIALSAMFGFLAVFCRPLALDLSLSYWDDEYDMLIRSSRLSPGYKMLRCATLPNGVVIDPWWVGQKIHPVAELNYSTASDFMKYALESDPADESGLKVGWEALWARSMMVRLPSGCETTSDTVFVRCNQSVIDHSVEVINGGQWVCGPQQMNRPSPIVRQVTRDFGILTLQVSINWSVWTPSGAGFDDIQSGISTLLDSGWQLDDDLWRRFLSA
ncbi:hypothetical protein [Nocardia crassostreae]|uniref:hypothetical protein n=1 Tax=Nocardia crassostreae TaxID=53428 RepID=UPI000A6D1F6B|nr:hypothetical protein [Nocardia crassostreae]